MGRYTKVTRASLTSGNIALFKELNRENHEL
jgi:hypothetical protein